MLAEFTYLFFISITLLIVLRDTCIPWHVHTMYGGQRPVYGVSSFLPAWESWGWNAGFQAWWQVPLPVEALALVTLHIIYVYRRLSPGLGETIQWLHSQIFDVFTFNFFVF